MSIAMKIRAQMKGDVAEIKLIVNHPMETGQRKDSAGNTIPAHFVQSLTVDVGGKPVVRGQTGPSVSTNPYFVFKVKGAKVGDEVVVNAVDNKGDKGTGKAAITA